MIELSPLHDHHQDLPCCQSCSLPTDYWSRNDGILHQTPYNSLFNLPNSSVQVSCSNNHTDTVVEQEEEDDEDEEEEEDTTSSSRKRRERDTEDQVSLLGVFVTVFRKSLVGACRSFDLEEKNICSTNSISTRMEIGVPTNVRHVAHVTFDRFNGFLGLPVEFEPEVPRRPPSASTSVFGVSTESMQLSFDSRGNSVPTILLMMQNRLYSQGALEAEGIFRINGENGQEEYMREQLNKGEVPENIDVHCLAGLIKAWFRELPHGLLDSLEPEQVMQAQSEEECSRLIRLLPPTEASLMDWAINLMADVAQMENYNKMNARNIAMVFAPNMTQMDDPLTALMYAVQVMNFLKTLIIKTLKEREDSILESITESHSEPSDENDHQSSSHLTSIKEVNEVQEEEQDYLTPKFSESPSRSQQDSLKTGTLSFLTSIENIAQAGKQSSDNEVSGGTASNSSRKTRSLQPSDLNNKKDFVKEKKGILGEGTIGKSRGSTIVSRLNSRTERIEAWR